ncbi:MAG TPA: hypothetical protein VGD37_19565 [Kofleriaceae bacterium]
MRWLPVVVIAAVIVALTAPAAAANHKILVLPVDGTADAATRARLTSEVARLARGLEGQVATGNATYADTALAVGCDPQAAGCSDEVIATLGVDELVWGTATASPANRDAGQVRLVVHRAVRGAAPREVATMIAAGDSGERVATGIAGLFAPPAARPEPAAPHPAAAPPPAPPPPADAGAEPPAGPAPSTPAPGVTDDRRDRTLGVALASGGGLGLVVGIALWASYSGLQDQIDEHPVRSFDDIQDLRSLEDKAGTRAIAGDVFVVAGLVAGGLGAYLLYRDHRRHAVAIAPAPIAHGGGLTITLIGGL